MEKTASFIGKFVVDLVFDFGKALIAGWCLMWAIRAAHEYWWHAMPRIHYWPAVLISWFIFAGFFSWPSYGKSD